MALIGFGTVGRAVAKILCESGGSSLRLTHICNRNVEKKRQAWVSSGASINVPGDVIWTDDVQVVLDSDVEIVIELIGGLHPAGEIVRSALAAGKSVVTANKQLIARHGSELLNWRAAGDARSSSARRWPEEFRSCRHCAPGCAETGCMALREF